MSLIKLDGISKTYQTGETTVSALLDINLEIEAGQFLTIMGASGSGKSTMLNLLGLLDKPSAGVFMLDGIDVSDLDDDQTSAIRCQKVGIVFQSFNLFSHFNILENVCVPMRYARMHPSLMPGRARELLELLGLGDRMTHRPTQLSGGQCQRVAIARALANDPPVILADEPTGNLDERTGWEVMEIFRGLVAQGRTVIMVTHNPEYEKMSNRVVTLHDGRIVS